MEEDMELETMKSVSSEVTTCAGLEVVDMEIDGNTDDEGLMLSTTCGTVSELASLEKEMEEEEEEEEEEDEEEEDEEEEGEG